MPLYPRRDVVHVAVSPHDGGCGASHTRPVTHGAPDPDWVLSCPRCEKALATSPQWARTRAEIPETPDEVTRRESLKNQKDRNLEEIQTAAMAHMAWGSSGPPNGITSSSVSRVICKNGHQNQDTGKYCSECGVSLSADAPSHYATLQAAAAAEPANPDYARIPVAELRRLAEQRGINPKQPKKVLVEALS